MASTYFSLIFQKLETLRVNDKGEHGNKLWQWQSRTDAEIIQLFCLCLELEPETEEDYSGKAQIITHLNKIWVKHKQKMIIQVKHKQRRIILVKHKQRRRIKQVQEDEDEENELETWPQHIQDLDLLNFELKSQQSKTQIQQWCQIFLRSSSSSSMQRQMQCNSTTNSKILDTCYNLRYSITYDPLFYNQIQILKNKLSFLKYSSKRVDGCIDSKELVEYTNFVHAFSNNAVFLICMYWAKEENSTEMNILLLDTLHKIKPFAAHVTASYFALLKSNNLIKEEYEEENDEDEDEDEDDSCSSKLLCSSPAKFVDFFFEDTILKDDFPSFREQLILLFKFLADVPHKKAEEEEEVIRSQIYGLLQEDAYLLLPISQMMKEDFSNSNNNNNLLTDFMDKIRVLNAMIIQLYYTNSLNIYFEHIRRELSCLKGRFDSVDLCLNEIRFLRSLFVQCFETWDDSDQETRLRLHSVVTSLHRIWGLISGRLYVLGKEERDMGLLLGEGGGDSADLEHLLDVELKDKFRMSKQEINTWLLSLSHCSFHCRPSTSNKILNFLDSILHNMRGLGRAARPCIDVAFKKQTEILEEKLLLVKNLLKLATNCVDSKNLEEFNILAQVFANNAACLIYFYWANWENDEFPGETNLMLCNMLLKIKPNSPHITRIYIGTLKAVCLQPYDSLLLERTVASFVDYFFEDLVVTPWKNDFQNLRDEVIFLLTFVHHHHHTGNAKEIIYSQLDVLFSDGVYDLLPFDDMKGDFSKKNVGLIDFLTKIGTENAKIRQLYCKFQDSFVYGFPTIIGQGFLDCLLQKLRNLTQKMVSDQKYVPLAKNKIMTIEQELVSLTPILNKILELTDLNDAGLEVVNVVYLAEHVTSLCFIFYHLTRYYIPYLSGVADRIKAVKKKLEKIEECNMYNYSRCLSPLDGRMNTFLEQDWTSEMVGFEIDEKIIIDNITRGSESLDIVSIVGMGGSGKTTLAKKIYGSPLVKSHFNIFAFSYVSQDHDKRKLLLDILRDIAEVDAKTSCMTEDDLAHKLWKCLSRQKYFIVLDDIWDINAWDEVSRSFPNDQNGSRVMFTTRSLEVAKRGQIKSCPHRLSFLTEDESRKLLQKKIFCNELPPPNLSDVVKVVAERCNGLPLAIVVIAGVLSRTEASTWIEISKNVSSYLSNDEGCMGILGLSYKNLPEYLKPCLLYLGAFPEDSYYTVRQVTLLWIAEGFIKESETKSLNDVAKEYLYELVDRSLLIVDEMTIGEISSFRVHDLIHQLCRKKCGEKNFFKQGQGIATSSFSYPSIYDHYRISMDSTADAKLSLANTHSLLSFDYSEREREVFLLRKLRFVQVLYLKRIQLQESDLAHVTSLLDLRHIEVGVHDRVQSIPSSISNLWNMQSLILRSSYGSTIVLPETLWRMKSLRYVKVHDDCKFEVSDGYELQLDKVVSFSKPYLYSGKDVEWLLQRLPNVRKLSCILHFERVETFDFHRKLECLKLLKQGLDCPYVINFPSTLIKLTLEDFHLSWTAISAILELQCLQILKLQDVSFPGPTWEMEDHVTFPNLKYFELGESNLELWNATPDSFPCLEQLYFDGEKLKELPSCFEDISSLKKITLGWRTPKLESSALRIREEQMELGNKVEVVFK